MVSRLLFLLVFSLLIGSRAIAEGSLSSNPLNDSDFDALPAFSAAYYLRANGDLANAYGLENYRAARQHWDSYGRYEGRPSSPAFHVRDYLELNADVRSQFGNDYGAAVWHFNTYGISEGRQSTHAYSVRDYIQLFGFRLTQGDFLAAHMDWIKLGIDYGLQSDNDFAVYKYLAANPDLARVYGIDGYVDAYIHWLIRANTRILVLHHG